MKQFGMTMETVLWGYSWANLVMLMATFSNDDPDKKDDIGVMDPMDFFNKYKNNGS